MDGSLKMIKKDKTPQIEDFTIAIRLLSEAMLALNESIYQIHSKLDHLLTSDMIKNSNSEGETFQ